MASPLLCENWKNCNKNWTNLYQLFLVDLYWVDILICILHELCISTLYIDCGIVLDSDRCFRISWEKCKIYILIVRLCLIVLDCDYNMGCQGNVFKISLLIAQFCLIVIILSGYRENIFKILILIVQLCEKLYFDCVIVPKFAFWMCDCAKICILIVWLCDCVWLCLIVLIVCDCVVYPDPRPYTRIVMINQRYRV